MGADLGLSGIDGVETFETPLPPGAVERPASGKDGDTRIAIARLLKNLAQSGLAALDIAWEEDPNLLRRFQRLENAFELDLELGYRSMRRDLSAIYFTNLSDLVFNELMEVPFEAVTIGLHAAGGGASLVKALRTNSQIDWMEFVGRVDNGINMMASEPLMSVTARIYCDGVNCRTGVSND